MKRNVVLKFMYMNDGRAPSATHLEDPVMSEMNPMSCCQPTSEHAVAAAAAAVAVAVAVAGGVDHSED
jgi:hypothetical protein